MSKHSALLTCLNPVDVLKNTLEPFYVSKMYGVETQKKLYVFGSTGSNKVNREVISSIDEAINFIKENEQEGKSEGIYFADLNEISMGKLLDRAIEENLASIEDGRLIINNVDASINIQYLESESSLNFAEYEHRSQTL